MATSGFVGLNDLKIMCKDKTRFKSCEVTFRNDVKEFPENKTFNISDLLNYKLALHKGKVICFADGVILKETLEILETALELNEHEPIEVEPYFPNLNSEEVHEKKESIEECYRKEKLSWINRLCKNEHLRTAINEGYDCDDEYITERLAQEWPGFHIVDESTTYWKNSCPKMESLKIEKRVANQINGYKEKYGTFARCCVLEGHNHENFNDSEAIVIHNYFGMYEVIGLVSEVSKIFN